MAIWEEITAMLKAPFVAELNLEDLFLIVGVTLIFITVWVLIIHAITETAKEL
jgi:hypothetical protein